MAQRTPSLRMVDQLNAFASEVTARGAEVGTDGKLGGQAQVPGVAGTWKDFDDNVNSWRANLTAQVRNSPRWRRPSRAGICRGRSRLNVSGEILQLKRPSTPWSISSTRSRARSRGGARGRGTRASSAGQAQVAGVAAREGSHRQRDSMANNLTTQDAKHRRCGHGHANGDLSKKVTVDVSGEILQFETDDQHMVRPAQRGSRRGHARGARGRHRGKARRTGRRPRRRGHVEGSHRQLSTRWRATSRGRCETSPRSRPRRPRDLSRKNHGRRSR